jgi:acyl dehydratase
VTTYFEDFVPGRVFELGTIDVTADEIIEFATKYDPQPFHIDPEAAEQSPFGGLIASGWHTCALFMRLLFDGILHDSSSQGSPGMDELRWLAPVRPGDRLSGRSIVEEANPSATKPNRGTVILRSEMVNQDGVVVLRMRGRGMYGRRPDGDVSAG